ncbi:hypothetical protein D3C86_1359800 [compost metagenome]
MLRSRQTSAMAFSSASGMMVPVGLAGLAMMTPAGTGSRARRASAVSWKRTSGPQSISTGSMCRAFKVLR